VSHIRFIYLASDAGRSLLCQRVLDIVLSPNIAMALASTLGIPARLIRQPWRRQLPYLFGGLVLHHAHARWGLNTHGVQKVLAELVEG